MGRRSKWCFILDQQVQDLSGKKVFSQTDLMWSEILRTDNSLDRVALIPYSRLLDFIKGEEMNPDAPCKFIRHQARSNEVLDNSSVRVSRSNVYSVYRCSYGPEDKRTKPDPPIRKRRQNIQKRGCGCHFIVKEIIARPGVAIITYNAYVHEDKNGWPCHGKLDKSGDLSARNAPRLPREMVLSVEAMYNLGLPIKVVYEQHILEVAEGRYDVGLKINQDGHLLRRDIINICNRLAKAKFQLHKNDSTSVNLWYQHEHKSFFFFQRPDAEDMPFIIGIQTEWMLRKMVEFSHNSFIAMDSTFRTNKYGYQLYTLLVFDTQQNALPVAWIVSSRNRLSDILRCLPALMERGRQVQPTWTINAFMTDDALVDIDALSAITGSRVLLCVWHFRRAWLKNMDKLATCGKNARKMFIMLGDIMNSCHDPDAISQAMNAFYIDFAEEERFLEYFSTNWMVGEKFHMCSVMASSSKSNFTIMATSSNFSPAATGVSSVSGNQLVEWQWQTDDLRWRSYDASCSAAIEAAHARGESSVEISVDQASTSTCVIYFQSQALRQVNLRTQRQRVVSRHAIGQGSTAIWQWWEAESNCWCRYDHQLASKFETAWLESRASQRSNKLDCPAGVLFKVNGQDYSLSFEADGMQYNVNDSCYRSVRRCIYLPNQQPSSSESPAMEKCHSLNASTVSLDQARSNKSEQPNISKDEHSYLIACPNPNDGENCSVCLSSLQEDEAVELAKCHHFFHRECITQWFKTRPSCPECLTIYGVITGTQPPGDMSIRYIPVKRRKGWDGLEGYPGVDIIEITYTFPNGIQTAEHPSPGNRYTGTKRVAYLPKNKEGEEVLELLKTAWNRRLIFTVGTSVTTGRSNTVVWAGIHHKTQKYGGSSNYGYPDEGYFDRVKKELALVNVI